MTMSYILKRVSDGFYVAREGMASSYTRDLRDARQFATHERANANACGNERITTPEQEMRS